MKKKTEQSELSDSKKKKYGIFIAGAFVIALVIGLNALSVAPVESQGFGVSEVKFYTRDGTQLNASDVDFNVYSCNTTGVNETLLVEYYNTFSNYVAEVLNSSFYDALEFEFEIKDQFVALLQITDALYFEQWIVLAPGENIVFLDQIPDAVLMSKMLKTYNSTSGEVTADITLQLIKSSSDFYDLENANCSIPNFWDDYETGERVHLVYLLNDTSDYTYDVMNKTYGETTIYEGDMYITLNCELSSRTTFEITSIYTDMGTPAQSLGFVWGDDFSTFTPIIEIDTTFTP